MGTLKKGMMNFFLATLAGSLAACTLAEPTPPALTPTPTSQDPVVISRPRFQVFILDSLKTCLVGNEFASGNVCAGSACGDCSCTWEQHDPPSPQVGVDPADVNDAQYASFDHKVCLEVTLTPDQVAQIQADMLLVREQVLEWTGGDLDLQIEFIILPHVHTGFTAPDFVIGPFEIDDELLNKYVTTSTDFIYVVTGNADPAQDLQLAAWCGSSYGEYSIHGAGYAYIQYNQQACNSVPIAGRMVYEPLLHEWIHNLDWALGNINSVPDLYQEAAPDWGTWQHASWPACGNGSSDPLDWFPSIDYCEWDPDWQDCNNLASAGACLHAGEVADDISWYEHVLSAHYPPNLQFIGNTCRDGRQDFSESGVDAGGPCP